MDTNSGFVYSINSQACKVCTHKVEDDQYWHTLVSMGIAGEIKRACPQELPKSMDNDHLKFIWFEIATNECNQRCIHCYTNSMTQNSRGDLLTKEFSPSIAQPKPRMLYKDWLRVIKQARELGCNACQFIGGEPLLYRGEKGETVIELAGFAKKVGYSSVEIFTNATLLTPDNILKIKEMGIKVAVSLYSDDPIIHNSVTQTPGSYAKTVNSLALLKKYGVETRVETVVMKANQESLKSTKSFIRKMGLHGRKPDLVRPNGRGEKSLIQPVGKTLIQYGFTLTPNFKASKKKIANYKSGHPCLNGKLVITEFGDILPCIFAREYIVGNYLAQNSLCEVISSSELQGIWHTTKDHVAVCQDCEYRYVCFDCRPLAEAAAQGRVDFRSAPYPRCTYNPYSGEWGNGVWIVDRQGEPYYDKSMALEIRQVRQSIKRSSYKMIGEMNYEG